MKSKCDTPDYGFTIIEALIVLAIFAILASVPIAGRLGCEAKWENSGMAYKWGFFSGCLVEVEKGRWLPEERVREIELPRKK